MIESKFEASVGTSRKWDAWEAGKEVARSTIEKLSSPPNFFLLFSTIHYEKYGGFRDFLNGVWDVLPEGTPLIGGTVAGFINNSGCFTRGATGFAVSSSEMDIAIGYGKNTKRNPVRAANQCTKMIKQGLAESNYPNKFVFSLISSSLVIDVPIIGSKKVIKSKITSGFFLKALPIMNKLLQIGVGREDEIFEKMNKELPGYSGIFGSSMDGMNFLQNYQFFNKNIFQNSIVSLALACPSKFDVSSCTGMKETDKKMKITKKTQGNRVIKSFNGKPATEEYFGVMGCEKNFLTDERIYDVAPYFPLGYTNDEGKVVAEVVPYYLGTNLMTSYKNEHDELSILSVSGKRLLNAVEEAFVHSKNKQKKFALMVSCATILYTLGDKVYDTQKIILDQMEEKPFLLVYTAGEGSFDPGSFYVGNETHTQVTFID
jgi:hypothetical protein